MRKVVFVFPTNRTNLLNEVKDGVSPDNGLYGLNYLRELEYEASFTDTSLKWQRLLDVILFPFDKIFKSQIDIGFQLGRTLLSLPKINRANVVVTNTDSIGLPVCFLKRLGFVKPPVIYAAGLFFIQGKLKNAIDGGKNTLFRHFYKWILSAADHIIYHSPIEKEKLIKLDLYNPVYCTFVAMGSDGRFFKKKRQSSAFNLQRSTLVLSVGRDHARDYKTLFEAAEKLSEIDFVVICSERNIVGLGVPNNVKVLLDQSYKQVAEWYQKAYLVVIPMKEMERSSGQMTLTDSFAARKPIIATEVKGIAHYGLKNNRDVILVSPGKAQELTLAIEKLYADKSLLTKLTQRSGQLAEQFSTKNYVQNIKTVVDWTVDPIKLKPLDKTDLEFLRKLRNGNRQYFLSNNYVVKLDQIKWFESYKKKNDDRMFILLNGKKKIGVGAIYHIDAKNKSAEIGRFAIDYKYRGKGYGNILLKEIEQIAFGELGLKELKLEVFADNKEAISLYEKNAFRENGQKVIRGNNVFLMTKAIQTLLN